MKNIFKNPSDNRLRAGWRILLFILIFWVFSSLIFIIKPLLGEMTKRAYLSNYSLIIVSVLAVSATAAAMIARKKFDKKSFTALGFAKARAGKDLLFGFVISGLMAASFFGITVLLGWIEFTGISFSWETTGTDYVSIITTTSLLSLTLVFMEHVLVGYWEELAFRGYLFQNMIEGMGLKIAIIISCILYGLIHASNPNATALSSLIIVAFGFIRIYGYLATQMLWLSIGMHIGWNFFQGPIFGFGASGHQSAHLLQIETVGPDWLSGGAFGPEGSIVIIPILVVALLAMKMWSERN